MALKESSDNRTIQELHTATITILMDHILNNNTNLKGKHSHEI